MDCHSINGQGCTEGVSLSSVGLRRNAEFLKQQLANPEEHVEKNKRAFNFETNLMTNPNLTKKETDAIVAYLQTLRKPVPKKGQKAKYYNTL
jgi:cbb3-type cytochrome oxidase cytochrome c subunit